MFEKLHCFRGTGCLGSNMSDDENDDKLTAGENKINICQINEMITCKVRKGQFQLIQK